MGRRARHSMPKSIGMSLNTNTGYYEAVENGVLYQLTFAQMNDMKEYIGYAHTGIEDWFNHIGRYERKNIKRQGHKEQDTGFYPDE